MSPPPEPSRCFTQRRTPGLLLVALAVLLAAAWLLSAAWRDTMALEAVLGLGVLFLLWRWVRLALSGRPLLCVGPAGLVADAWGGMTVAWSDVADLEARALGRQLLLDVALRPGSDAAVQTAKPWRGRTRRTLSVWQLPPAEAAEAARAVNQAFEQHAGGRSRFLHAERQQAERAEDDFQLRLQRITPSVWGLYLVMAVNIGVWLANVASGMDPFKATTPDLLRWGANSATAVLQGGEVWRLLTATVLHGGLLHLSLNMAALWDAGRQVCRWYGNGQFLMIYLGAALMGSALSLHFAAQHSVSVGASGAVFGVLGALMFGVWRHRDRVPPSLARHLLKAQGAFVLITLLQGLLMPGIDNAAHLGGLLGGCLVAWQLVEVVEVETGRAKRWLGRFMALLIVGATVLALKDTAPRPAPAAPAPVVVRVALQQVLRQLQAAEFALQRDAQAREAGQLSPQQFVVALEQRHIPSYRALLGLLAQVDAAQSPTGLTDVRAVGETVLALMQVERDLVRGRITPQQAAPQQRQLRAQLKGLRERLRALAQAQAGQQPPDQPPLPPTEQPSPAPLGQ